MNETDTSFKIFSLNGDEIDTIESYRGAIYSKGDTILIPLINIGISEHVLNNSVDFQFIDYGYLLFEEVTYFIKEAKYIDQDLFYIGAVNLISDEQEEIAIKSGKVSIVLKAESKISTDMWIPVNTPNFRQNLYKNDVEQFLNDDLDSILRRIQ